MIKKCCAFLSALMIVLFSTFSQYAAIPAYAAMDPRYYVAAGPLIASMFTAYGYKRSGTNAALANLVAEAVVDAADAGYTTVRNGVESIAIGIQNGTSYVSNAFNEWLYNWCNSKGMSTPKQESNVQYPSGTAGTSFNFVPFSGGWSGVAAGLGFPGNVLSEFLNHSSTFDGYNFYVFGISENTYPESGTNIFYKYYYIGRQNIKTDTSFTLLSKSSYGVSYITTRELQYLSANGYVRLGSDGSVEYHSGGAAIPVVYGSPVSYSDTGSYVTNYKYSSTFNVTYSVEDAGYTVSADAPAANITFTEYMSNPASWSGLSWGGKVANVPIDNVDTQAVPITIPIDIVINGQQIGAAVADIISGAQAAIDAALAMTQQVAREGTITQAAQGELEEANTAVDNSIEVADAQPIVNDILGWGIDYVKPHLSNVFKKYPFSIPYDIYLVLNSLYSGANSHRVLRSVKLQDSRASGSVDSMNPNTVGVIVDFDYVSKDSVSESDPNAPNFLYDFNISAFGKTYHFVGILDFAPFGGLIKLGKVCIGFLWILNLLLWNYNDIKGVKKNG